MRSPVRNGTVPSHAIATPLNAISTSSAASAPAAWLVGLTRRMSTPFCLAAMPCARRSASLSMRCHATPRAGKPVKEEERT